MGDVLMKSATGLTGSGSRDWAVQRISAIVLALYTVVVLGWMITHPQFGYEAWYGFMMTTPMKIFSLLAVASLAGHAWVGLWTVLTDYVTTRQMGPSANGIRLVLQAAMVIAVFVFTVWGIQIFWG